MQKMINIFIPSYHRPTNVKTAKYFVRMGYDPKKIHVFVDSETDDISEYEIEMNKIGVQLHVFDMEEARKRYDYVHRASVSRRSAGQARNMFQDFAKQNGIDFYLVMDDDTQNMQNRPFCLYLGMAKLELINTVFLMIEDFMRRRKIGLFALSQTGDIYGRSNKIFRKKVMNTTFYLLPYVYRGERGVQDDDTSLFTGVMNEGLFTGSMHSGVVLQQTASAVQAGGLTDLYNECKLLNKALVTPIQFPSAIHAERQVMNGGRLHHRINYKYLFPQILKGTKRDNIAWDTYPEDYPFTNEPKRIKTNQQ